MKRKSTRRIREIENKKEMSKDEKNCLRIPENCDTSLSSTVDHCSMIPACNLDNKQNVQSDHKFRTKNLFSEVKALKETCSTRMEIVSVITIGILKDGLFICFKSKKKKKLTKSI